MTLTSKEHKLVCKEHGDTVIGGTCPRCDLEELIEEVDSGDWEWKPLPYYEVKLLVSEVKRLRGEDDG